jgi:large subunit ribosomal protein L9
MKVFLLEKVIGLGEAGAIANVSDGYYRNFLLPRKLAVPATAGAMKLAKEKSKGVEAARIKAVADAREIAEKLAGTSLAFTRKVSEGETLYGSVTAADILESLKKKGFSFEKKAIGTAHIKTVGEFQVAVQIHPEVAGSVTVTIVPEG